MMHLAWEGAELFARAPISELTMVGLVPNDVASVVKLPFAHRVVELSIENGAE
jgi:hypothetical protein